jgi:hypothetical protein
MLTGCAIKITNLIVRFIYRLAIGEAIYKILIISTTRYMLIKS